MSLRAVWRLLIAVPPLWILVLNQLLFAQVGLAEGHSKAIVDCKENILYKQAVHIGVDLIFESTGLYVEHYDTNGDGKFDVLVLSHMLTATAHAKNPVFWIVDTDYDGEPDAVYIDKKGLGVCTDIVLYQDLHAIHGEYREPIDSGRGV